MTRSTRPLALAALVASLALVSGCAAPEPAPTTPAPEPTATETPTDTGHEGDPYGDARVQPSGEVETVVGGLDAPWSMVRLANGSTVISERDTARIRELTAEGDLRTVGTIGPADAGGEGGLLGLAVLEEDGTTWLYTYATTANDNRVLRSALVGEAGALGLGESEVIRTGFPKSSNHNGGRIAFGPDGMLYVLTGDAGSPERSQNPDSRAGKILRLTPTGGAPDDNPTEGSPVYSLGHRNPQGIAFAADGQVYAAEFGQNTWDEFNRIDPGANYGWPRVEGEGGGSRYTDPLLQWGTDESSPSGLARIGGTYFLAGLGGERLWVIQLDADGDATAEDWFVGDYGRIRDVIPGPEGTLWMLTNNTDGRGDPRSGDDRILQVELEEVG